MDAVGYFHAEESGPQGFRTQVNPQLFGKWNGQSTGKFLEAGLQADLLLMFPRVQSGKASPTSYFELPEAYVGTSPKLASGWAQLSIGRRLETWSHLDEEWRLGIWQPRFRWDYLHPESVGLTGAFLALKAPWFRVVAWGSPIFIPERGVSMDAQDGSFRSDSRWFVPPPSMVSIFGRGTPVRYSLMVPEMRDLVEHAGGSIMARVGREGSEGADAGFWGSVGYAFKPINQLVLSSDGYLQLSEREAIRAEATIYPRVGYHHLASLEGGYDTEAVDAWFSVLSERPDVPSVAARQTTQALEPALAMSSTVDVRVAGGLRDATRVDLSYLRQWGGNAGDRGPQAAGGSATSFEARYPFQTAVAVGVKSAALRRVQASTRLMYDVGHRGAVWSTELKYLVPGARNAWRLGVGADLMSAPETIGAGGAGDADGTRLISRFRANDRVHAGVTYVF